VHPADISIHEIGTALRSGRLSSVELVQAHLDRITKRDGKIGAFVHVAGEEALAAAQRADDVFARGEDLGPLHGIPFAVKDLIDVAGWPVRFGSRRYASRIAETSAPAVRRLTDAGAIPLGLVATYELATVGPDPTSLYPQPRNPWGRAHVTGGSSSGSAAAVAAGLVRIALGSDTGGSVRSPAAYCGVSGFKPQFGDVSGQRMQPLAPSMDTMGVIGRNVADIAAAMEVLSGVDGPSPDIAGLGIGYARNWAMGDASAHADLLPLLDAAASALSLAGARIEVIDLPEYGPVEALAAQILQAEVAETYRDVIDEGGRDVGSMAFESLLWGKRDAADKVRDWKAGASALRDELEACLLPFDAVITPTILAPALPFDAFAEGAAVWTAMRTIPFSLSGHPALSVPMGFADGLPLGLQIVGAFGRSATVLQIGAAYEAATDHTAIRPYLA
jgi:aspartyl-tRNA(Asn)/glutamyl-tRNA(Gln) amidotransferase subunit A